LYRQRGEDAWTAPALTADGVAGRGCIMARNDLATKASCPGGDAAEGSETGRP
jgi:hypothetical protein